jgi:hypothetical protein
MTGARPEQRGATAHLTYFAHAIAFVGPQVSDSRAHVASDWLIATRSRAQLLDVVCADHAGWKLHLPMCERPLDVSERHHLTSNPDPLCSNQCLRWQRFGLLVVSSPTHGRSSPNVRGLHSERHIVHASSIPQRRLA